MSRTDARDEGLARVSSITRWVAAVGVAGTALLAALVYKDAPGRSVSATTPTPAAGGGSSVSTPGPSQGSSGLQAPIQAPAPVQQVPIVRSGAS